MEKKINIRMDEELVKGIDEYSSLTNMNRSEVVREAVRRLIKK